MPSAITPPISSTPPRPLELRATGCAAALREPNSPRRRGRSASPSPSSPWCQKCGVTGPMLARRLVVACKSAFSASACRLVPKKRRGASTAAVAASSAARRRPSKRDCGGGELRARRPSLPIGLRGGTGGQRGGERRASGELAVRRAKATETRRHVQAPSERAAGPAGRQQAADACLAHPKSFDQRHQAAASNGGATRWRRSARESCSRYRPSPRCSRYRPSPRGPLRDAAISRSARRTASSREACAERASSSKALRASAAADAGTSELQGGGHTRVRFPVPSSIQTSEMRSMFFQENRPPGSRNRPQCAARRRAPATRARRQAPKSPNRPGARRCSPAYVAGVPVRCASRPTRRAAPSASSRNCGLCSPAPAATRDIRPAVHQQACYGPPRCSCCCRRSLARAARERFRRVFAGPRRRALARGRRHPGRAGASCAAAEVGQACFLRTRTPAVGAVR